MRFLLGVLVPFVVVWATVRRMASVLRPRFVGYKRAMVLLAPGLFDFSRPAVPSPNTFRFGAVATALTYAVVDRAVCYAAQANQLLGSVVVDQADHDPAKVPVWECMCGFYALRSPREPASFRFPGSSTHPAQPSLLQVDLFGTVLEGERGFRASGQAVRSVTFAPRCGWCGAPTEKLGMGPSLPSGVHSAHLRYLEPLCSEHACSELYAPEVFQFRLGLPLSLDGDVASGVCSHAAELPDVARYFEEVRLLASQIEDHPGLLG